MTTVHARISLQQGRANFFASLVKEVDSDLIQTFNIHVAKAKLLMLNTHWEKFEAEHEAILMSKVDISDTDYVKKNVFETIINIVIKVQAALEERIASIQATEPPSGHALANSSANVAPNIRSSSLPKILIEVFSGSYADWRSFSDLFVALVGENDSVKNAEKFVYLRNSLSGNAASLISNIRLSADSFQVAWDMLVKRYENKRLLITAQLEKLLSLKKTGFRSSHNLNSLLNTVEESTNSLKALGLPVNQWDAFIVHLITQHLDSKTREDWEMHLGADT